MWKEAFDGETVDRMPTSYFAEDGDSPVSRRVSAASDDSFDASSYIHVDSKLNSKMPKCLLNDENSEPNVGNHFTRTADKKGSNDVTKSGKRIIRKRLSVTQFNARLKNLNNNNSKNMNNNDLSTSSSSDSDTLPKPEKKSTDVLSAKIQHLVFEMKRLRQLDRDILRKFLVINDTIDEQRWMVEEKQEAIKRSLSEEGEDPVVVNFDFVPEIVPEEHDDEESIQSVLSRQNSSCEVFDNDETLPADETPVNSEPSIPASKKSLDSDLVSTSSDSALSMSGASSTLSSTTSIPVSNRSTSPPSSNVSNASTGSSSLDKTSENSTMTVPSQSNCTYSNESDFAEDIEGYYRMHGASMKRGSYPFPRQTQSFNAGSYHNTTKHYDDGVLGSSYSTRRGSNDSDSREAAEYARAVRRSIINRSYTGPFRSSSDVHQKPRPRSASSSQEPFDTRNHAAKRISVRPDGTVEAPVGIPSRRPYLANDKTSAAYRLLQHPSHQRHLARTNIGRQFPHLAFVPIAEQEPDIMYENGRLYSNDSDNGTKFDSERRDYQNRVDVSTQRQTTVRSTRQCPPVIRKPSAAGSAGSLTSSSSRTSSSSLTSSASSSSLHSPTKFVINEADSYSRPVQEPVWVQRRRHTVQANEYIAIPHNRAFPASYVPKYYNHGAHNLPEPEKSIRPVPKSRSKIYTKTEKDRVLTVSYKPTNKGANEAVYNWIQTQDDVTYL